MEPDSVWLVEFDGLKQAVTPDLHTALDIIRAEVLKSLRDGVTASGSRQPHYVIVELSYPPDAARNSRYLRATRLELVSSAECHEAHDPISWRPARLKTV